MIQRQGKILFYQPDLRNFLGEQEKAMKNEIDGLLRDLYASWIGDTAQLTTKLTASNKDLNACIADIEKDIKFAENVVKALDYVDDVIKIAADLVS